ACGSENPAVRVPDGGPDGSGNDGPVGDGPPAGDASPDSGTRGSAPVCSTDGWCWEYPHLLGTHLLAVRAFAADDVWMVGSAGTAVDGNGSNWTITPTGTKDDLHALWGASAADLWAVGAARQTGEVGAILHWDGVAWSKVALPSTSSLFGIWGASSTDVW